MNERVLIFGGSFDPPHIGHVELLRCALRAARPGRVIIIPAGMAPHKRAPATPGALRAAMCACFLPLFAPMEISEIELAGAKKSYTVDTLRALRARLPEKELYLCMGGDMLQSFTMWRDWRNILDMAAIVACGRGGAENEAAAGYLRGCGARVLLADGDIPGVSSAQIRALLAEGCDARALLPPPVMEIITANHLYA